ncbi:MAG: DUF2273 domain-containing protein [Clostridia bacterium]|nr:DUF2273 domain-containing protein [Clostridia bacterium]
MDKEKLLELYYSHRGGINGALVGLVTAAMILILGFFRVLFIAICVGIGYYIGKRLSEDKDYIKNLLDRILPPGTYR